MRLRQLDLQHFRGIEACDLELLADEDASGITVIEGPNEAGKTSVADAVRVLFEYPHSSRHREIRALQPAGRDVPTTVRLRFDHGDLRVTYAKTYNRDAGAELAVRGGQRFDLTGKEAHERAQQLLGAMVDVDLWRSLQVPQGLVAQPDIAGAPALLTALDTDGAPPDGGGRVSTRREGGADDRDAAVMEQVLAERGRWRTTTGRDRRPLTDLEARHEALHDELAAAQQVVDAVTADLDEIAALRAHIPEQRRALTRAGTELAGLEGDRARLDERRASLERHEETLATARARTEVAQQAVDRRRELIADAVAAAAQLDGEDRDDPAALERAGEQADAAAAAGAAAERVVARQRNEVADSRRRHEQLRGRGELAQLTGRRDRLAALDAVIAQHDQQIASATIDDDALARLRSAQAGLSEARAALSAGQVAVQITALTATHVRDADGSRRELAAGASTRIELDGVRPIELGELVRLDLAEGQTLRRLAGAVEDAQRVLLDELDRCGVGSLAEAEAAGADSAAIVRARSDALAERGALCALDSYADLDDRIGVLTERLGQAASDAAPTDGDVDAALQAVHDCEQRLNDAEARHRDATAAAEGARRAHDELRLRWERQEAEERSARRSLEAAQERLTVARAAVPDDALEQSLRDRQAALAAALDAQEAAVRALDEADHGGTDARWAAARAAVNSATARLDEDERQLAALEAAVAARSETGPVARRDALGRDLERVGADLARRRRRADAAALAAEVLERHRTERRRRYLSPLRDEIERLGAILWGPDFSVDLDDDLQIRTRLFAGRALDFDQLSLGAREQLTLISRLACAIVVGPAGGPIIVDDALGFSDPERLRRMGAVLTVAGRSTQLLLLTCQPQRYVHVAGARTVRLRGSKPGRRDPAAA